MIPKPQPRYPWFHPRRWAFEVKWLAVRGPFQNRLQKAVGASDEQMAEWTGNWLNGEKP